MPTDRTPYFKARAKLIASKDERKEIDCKDTDCHPRALISPVYYEHWRRVTRLAKELTEFSTLVVSQQTEYLSFNSPFVVLSDSERDMFDADSEKALSQLSSSVTSALTCVESEGALKKHPQEREHLRQSLGILRLKLSRTASMVASMRKLRIRHIANRQKFGNLRGLAEHVRASGQSVSFGNLAQGDRRLAIENQWDDESNSLASTNSDGDRSVKQRCEWTESSDPQIRCRKKMGNVQDRSSPAPHSDAGVDEPEPEFAEGEKAQLLAENEKIYEKFAHVHADLDGLETQISEIQRLQETFAEKLMEQEREIEVVHETAVHTTENLKDANEWIREAISDSASRRVIVLFCIIVITFALLFIDWYNP